MNHFDHHHMKWWGWGDPHQHFTLSDKPFLWPFIVKTTGINEDPNLITNPVIPLEDTQLPPARRNDPFFSSIESVLRPNQIFTDHYERLIHSFGKSFRDLWRMRNGLVSRAPDCICYPESEEDVVQILAAAEKFDVVVIPFGGGSNIAGCLENCDDKERMVLSLDMRRMNRVTHLDPQSMIAKVETGAMGPELEKQLNAAGMTLGHFPDSFQFSSVGGWVATRSAGMQSDKYGKIEDMVIAMRLVTPKGKIITRTVPKSSNGIDIKHLCIGSEGVLGVITEVTLQIHLLPEKKESYAFLFPNFKKGVNAIEECVKKECTPSMTRLNDPGKTALSFAFKTQGSFMQRIGGWLIKQYLKTIKKMDFNSVSLLLVCFEGTKKEVQQQKKKASEIYKKWGAVSLGQGPGKSFQKNKYDFPYIRDFMMDRGVIVDVSETSTVWSNLLPLYEKASKEITQAIAKAGGIPFCTCHISHTYQTGASLYFSFACKQRKGEELSQYLSIKKAAEDAFMRYGGTLSHHHAVGFEHLPWIHEDVSDSGILALKALKNGLDPQGIMNPGKIVPTEKSLGLWYELSK